MANPRYDIVSACIALLALAVSVGLVPSSFAQTGPGGVGNAGGAGTQPQNILWLPASEYSSGTWTDVSGNNNDATATADNPSLVTNELNGQPVVSFNAGDGTTDALTTSSTIGLPDAPNTVIVVARRSSGATDTDQLLYDEGGSGGARVLAFRLNVQGNVNETLASINGQNFKNSGISTSDATTTSFNVLHSNFDGSNLDLVVNGSSKASGAGSSKSGGVGSIGDNLTGDIAEVIAYDASLNAAQVRIVLNYLQEKYDITIEEDDFGFGAYATDLAGIGYTGTSIGVAGGGSHLAAQSSVLQLSRSSFDQASGDQFVLFGHDDASLSFSGTTVNGNADAERVDRTWRVDLTGTTVNRSVNVTIDRSALPGLSTGFNDYAVYVDGDGDFSSGATFYDLSSSGEASISVNNGDYITIARINRTISFAEQDRSEFEPATSGDPNLIPTLNLTLNFPNNEDLTVEFDVASGANSPTVGSDYETCCSSTDSSAPFSFTFTANNTTLDLNSRSGTTSPLEVLGDNVDDTNTEFVDVALRNLGGTDFVDAGSITTTSFGIVDEDITTTASFNGSDRSKSEENTGTFTVTVDIRDSGGNLTSVDKTVGFELGGTATLGEDYERADGQSSTEGTLDFSGSSQASFDLNVLNDDQFEGSETIVVTLDQVEGTSLVTLDGASTGTLPTLTLTITEGETEPDLSFTASSFSGTEGTNVGLTVELSAAAGTDVTVDFSASNVSAENGDYSFITSSPLTIPAGQTTETISVSLVDDSDLEANEIFDVSLSNATNASLTSPQTTSVTILDDDIVGANGPGGVGDTGALRTWLRADEGVPTTDGANVSTWEDQSGNGNDATAVSGNEPEVSTSVSALNGQPAVTFMRGNSDYLEVPFLTDVPSEDNTLFVVWNQDGTNSPQGIVEVAVNEDTGGKLPQARALEFDGGDVTSVNGRQSTSISSVSPGILTSRFVESSGTLDLRERSSGNTSSTTASAESGSRAVIGARYEDTGGNKVVTFTPVDFLDADLAEIAVYERALNKAQRIIVSNALAAKYGFSLSGSEFIDFYSGDDGGKGNYDVEVVGVGSEGSQPEDKHFNATAGAVTLRINSFSSGEYVFVGDKARADSGNRVNVTDVPSGTQTSSDLTARSDFDRFIDTVGQPRFDIGFDLSELGLRGPVGDLTNYRLLFFDTGDNQWKALADATGGTVAGREATGDRITFTGVQFPSSGFQGRITIGTTNQADSPIDTRYVTLRGDGGTGNDAGYYHFAAPIATSASATFDQIVKPDGTSFINFDGSTDPNPIAAEMIYTWDASTQQYVSPAPGDNLTNAEGIYLWLDDTDQGGGNDYRIDPELTFGLPQGTSFQTADRSVSVPYCSSNCSDPIFYMLGNPYVDAYDLSSSSGLTDLASNGFQATVEVWDRTNAAQFGSYDVKTQNTTGDEIARWQGFFIERTDPSSGAETLTFNNSGRLSTLVPFIGSKTASTKQRPSRDVWARLRLQLDVRNSGEVVARDKAAVLFFHEDASAQWDPYDANKYEPLTDTYATLSLIGEGRDGSTRAKAQESRSAAISDLFTVDLQLNVQNVDGTFALSPRTWEFIPNDWEITLVDTKGTSDLGDDTVVDLTKSTTYTFDVSSKSITTTNTKTAPADRQRRPQMKTIQKSSSTPRFRLRVDPGSALPVQLAALNAEVDGRTAILKWTTTSETDNAGFAVERKREDGSFEKVGYVEGSGTTSKQQSYRYRVENLGYGEHTFRLQQVDQGGATSYSKNVSAEIRLDEAYDVGKAYPNPFRSTAKIDVTVRKRQHVRAEVYDVLGRRIQVIHDGEVPAQETETLRVRSNRLASGMYFVRVKGESFSEVRRVVLVK